MDEVTHPLPAAEIPLPGDPRSAGEARRFLASTVAGWGMAGFADDAALLVSELVTNAALHAGTDLLVRIERRPDCLLVSVTDGSPRPPVLRHYSDQSTTGRGLGLVSALARRWGTNLHLDGGKTVWAEVAVPTGSSVGQSTSRSSC